MTYTIENLYECLDKSEKIYDREMIKRAYEVADEAHKGQLRLSNEPYVSHPIAVACILAELGMDNETIVAALLHDVVEDTETTSAQIQKMFGVDVALLVDGVTKLGKIPLSTREEQQSENVRKMLLAMSQDIRVIIIKLADRLHNLRTLEFQPPQKQRDKALETMEVYAPIAHRLGIRAVKEELEDISLKYLDNIAYTEIEQLLSRRKDERENVIRNIKTRITERMTTLEKEPYVEGRVKSIYGIYRKMYMQGREFEEIYDIYAVRIIVDTDFECYNVLGIIHDMFTPIPNRFKDYISTPKPNGYQSLHTTVIGKDAVPFEVQIRTWDMHYTAEYGIAAHWKYKAGIQGKDKLEERLAWIRQLLEAQQESDDFEEIVQTIKTDLSPDEVFVFTPKGDVISLPAGSTVIDFAYAIHTAVGNRMIGAKVGGRMVSLDYQVATGDIVEIITTNQQGHGPSRNWLKLVRTSEARGKIRSWFKKERREENIVEGKLELEREFRRNSISLEDDQMRTFIESVARRQHCASIDDFFAAIGYGGILLSKIMPRVRDDYVREYRSPEPDRIEQAIQRAEKEKKNAGGVIIEGLDNCLVKFAKCCNPVPGDDIIGFVTRGFGVSVHKKDCPNANLERVDKSQAERWVNAHWAQSIGQRDTFKSTLQLLSNGRQGVLADLSIQLSNFKVPIHALNARELKGGQTEIMLTIGITGIEQLSAIILRLKKIEGVESVERSGY